MIFSGNRIGILDGVALIPPPGQFDESIMQWRSVWLGIQVNLTN